MHVVVDSGLDALNARVRRDLELLRYPDREWVEPRHTQLGQPIYDVIVVGAGQGGLATAFGLLRERVSRVLVVDENPLDRAGPWLSFARMRTLRTPKYLTGPDLGVPSLSARAWYEAQHGEGSWESLRFVPREDWAAYLAWYRHVLALPVRAETRVGALTWSHAESAWEVPCESAGERELLYARRVVLATGIDGSGAWQVPALVQALPRSHYAHTHEPIDFAALRHKRVAVIGAGASAFDNAAVALEHGASEVRMFVRRARLVDVNPYRWAEFVGFLKHFGDLADAQKWRFVRQLVEMGQLPPSDTYERARAHAGFHLHTGSAIDALSMRAGAIALQTRGGAYEADYLIVGTGFRTDLSLRPELAHLAPLLARWSDRYTPLAGEEDGELGQHPYLGPHFEFCARAPAEAPFVAHLYNYTFGGLLSLGLGGASISGMKYSIPRLVAGITRSFFLEQSERHFEALRSYDVKEF